MGRENEFGCRFHEFEVPVGPGSRDNQYIVCNMEPKMQFWQFEHKNKSDEQDQGEGTERGEQGAKVDPQRGRGGRRIKTFLRTSSRNGNSGGKR